MNEEQYKRNIEIMKDKLNSLRDKNRDLSNENSILKKTLSQVNENTEKLKSAMKKVETSYSQVVRAYEKELDNQLQINKSLHTSVTTVKTAFEKLQDSFVGKVLLFFSGKKENDVASKTQ